MNNQFIKLESKSIAHILLAVDTNCNWIAFVNIYIGSDRK